MPQPRRRPPRPRPQLDCPPGSLLEQLATRSQLDFEVEFFSRLLDALPDHVDALVVHSANLSTTGRHQDGLAVDERLVQIRPTDPAAHYNLACRYALLHQVDLALGSLRRAIELGFRDTDFLERDRDLDSLRKDPRFRALLRECRSRSG